MTHAPRARHTSLLWHPWAGFAARLAVGGVFVYASIGKIAHPDEFARAIYAYRILHMDLVNLAAIWLPWVEILAGALLIVGVMRRSAAAVTTGLTALFIGAAWLGLMRGLDVDCGCFLGTVIDGRLGWSLVARDAVLLGLSAYAMVHPSDALSLDRFLVRADATTQPDRQREGFVPSTPVARDPSGPA